MEKARLEIYREKKNQININPVSGPQNPHRPLGKRPRVGHCKQSNKAYG